MSGSVAYRSTRFGTVVDGSGGVSGSDSAIGSADTRNSADTSDNTVPFEQALLRGLAPDGGLYVPVDIPQLPAEWREKPNPAGLPEVALEVLPPFMGSAGAQAVAEALNFDVPVVRVGEHLVLELFHGPTAAFKDIGARSLARLMQAALGEVGRSATILVATSGDTGSAVADAFAGLEGLQVALLYPKGGVSRVQEEQLIASRRGVRAFAVQGTFDDCQRMVKEAFADPVLGALGLTSANSISIGRLLPQMLYYVWAVAQARNEYGVAGTLEIVVPSGNLGNLAAGLLAQRMGLSNLRFISAHNANDYFARYLRGQAGPFDFAPSVATLSNAMDVGAPSNFERLHTLFGDDLKTMLTSEVVDDETTLRRMRLTYDAHGYLACPHTAVGLEAAARSAARLAGGLAERSATTDEPADDVTRLVLSTAHPAKFPESVQRATGVTPETPTALARFSTMGKSVEQLGPTLNDLRAALLSTPAWN